jgi:hypothetical protein
MIRLDHLTGTADRKLAIAIDRAYSAFSQYSFPWQLDGSPMKPVHEILSALSSVPLRHLGADKIGPYSGSAIWTIGDINDYKHFLPRIMELSITYPNEHMGLGPEIIALKLNQNQWLSWQQDEQVAIEAVFFAAWKIALSQHPMYQACSWLHGIACLEVRVSDALDLWWATPSPFAALNCASLILDQSVSLEQRTVLDWDDVRPAINGQIAAWLLSDRIAKWLL